MNINTETNVAGKIDTVDASVRIMMIVTLTNLV
jgi:hypothetical protein